MLTVKELREFLDKYEDDVKIVTVSDNYEMGGSTVDAHVSEGTYRKDKKRFRDDFDGTSYSSEIYRHDNNGEKVIYIRG